MEDMNKKEILKEPEMRNKVEIFDFEAIIEKTISNDGKLWALSKWSNRKAWVIIEREIGNEKSGSVGGDIIE